MEKVVRSRLKHTLEERGMKLVELQRLSGVSYQTLHALYSNKTTQIKFNTLDKICTALHCQLTSIIEYVPE